MFCKFENNNKGMDKRKEESNMAIENNVVFLKSNKEFFNKADLIEKIILDNELTKIG